jgi:3-deoxy-manno-octulosonate cytidylyltransferase (CMP-KDO synthetase)
MILGLIPSRLNSKRLREKPLLKIDELPIIVHAYKRALMSKKLDDLIVCTDHEKIKKTIEDIGGKAILTSPKHKNGTERIYEVAKKFRNLELIIDIQGDQPLIDPISIDKTISFHKKNKKFDIVLPSMPIKHNQDNPSLVKTIFSKKGDILYFSRAKTPFDYKKKNITYYKNLSVISFKPSALKKFFFSEMGTIEKIENIELMRALENNLRLGTFVIEGSDFAVDIQADFFRAVEAMRKDKLRKLY